MKRQVMLWLAALKAGKIDYFLASTEVAGSLLGADDGLRALAKPVRVLDIGAMFAKDAHGEALRAQWTNTSGG